MRNLVHILSIIWGLQRCLGYNFTKFNEPTGAFMLKTFDAYVTYDSWRLLYYYDLSDFYENIEIYANCLDKMDVICQVMPEKNQCETLQQKYKKMLSNLQLDVDYMKKFQIRKRKEKRNSPFGFIGSLWFKSVFGMMDEDDAHDVITRINSLTSNQKLHTVILENNLSLIRNTIRITNATFEEFRETVDKLHKYLDNVTHSINEMEREIKLHIDFKYLATAATLLIMEHEKTTHLIKQTLKNALHGEYTELISHKQLIRDLHEVEDNLDDSSAIMFIDDLKQLQDIITIRGTIIEKRLLVDITIPILRKDLFKVHNVVVLPIKVENKTILIDTESKAYLVNNVSRSYIPMSRDDMRNCKLLQEKTILCFPQAETYLENSENCESNILFEHDTHNLFATCGVKQIPNMNFIEPLMQNTYYIYITKPMTVRENCVRKTSNYSTLSTIGILEMDPHCEIIINGMNIYAKSTLKRDKIYQAESPRIFHKIAIQNLTLLAEKMKGISRPAPLKYINSNEDFSKLSQKTDIEFNNLKAMENITLMESSSIQNNLIIVISVIAALILINYIIKKCC